MDLVGNIPLLIAGLIGGSVIAYKVGGVKTAKRLFDNDPAAATLTPAQKKFIILLYRQLEQYDQQALGQNNATLAQALEMGAIAKFNNDPNPEQYGHFAAIGYEYQALVQVRAGNNEAARASIQKALEVRGDDQLVTARARGLLQS